MLNVIEKEQRKKALKLNTYIFLDAPFLYPLPSSLTLTTKDFLGPVDSDSTFLDSLWSLTRHWKLKRLAFTLTYLKVNLKHYA